MYLNVLSLSRVGVGHRQRGVERRFGGWLVLECDSQGGRFPIFFHPCTCCHVFFRGSPILLISLLFLSLRQSDSISISILNSLLSFCGFKALFLGFPQTLILRSPTFCQIIPLSPSFSSSVLYLINSLVTHKKLNVYIT